MKRQVSVNFKGNKILIDTKVCSFFGKFWGLMFSSKKSASVLLFDFGRSVRYSIHSFFVLYDFLAVWVDKNDKVIQVDRVKPWVVSLKPKKKYQYLIEIPINTKNKKLVEKFTQA